MKAGFAQRDITPQAGARRAVGYGTGSVYKGVHDPCKVRAAVFEDAVGAAAALVGVDVCYLHADVINAARAEIERRCGLSGGAIMVGASHTHSGGAVGRVQPGQFDDAPDAIRKLARDHMTHADPAFLDRVRGQLVEAVCAAFAARVEARCAVGAGREETVSFNRRLRMKNGLTQTHPRPGNPGILGYAGPIDPEVGALGAWDLSGRFLGAVVNFACHGTTNPAPGCVSADWICYLERTALGALASGSGEGVVVFLNGACGDVTQVDNIAPTAPPFGESMAWRVGGRVGAEAVKALLGATPGELGPVSARRATLPIPRRAPSRERVERCWAIVERKLENPPSADEWNFAREIVVLDEMIRREPMAEVELQAIQIGPAVFLAHPAELFCQYGLDIKAARLFPFTFPVELANGFCGYAPTEDAFGEHGGGYETRLTTYTNLEPAAGRKIRDGLIELARALTPGAIPPPPPSPPFTAPWAFGAVAAELE